MANHMSSLPIPCRVIITETVDVGEDCLEKGRILYCIKFDPINNEYVLEDDFENTYNVKEECIEHFNEKKVPIDITRGF